MPENILSQLLLAACVSVGVSVPMSIVAFLLRGIFQRNTEAVESLQKTISDIQIQYPQTFVKKNEIFPVCQRNEELIQKHDGQIKVINNKLDIKS